MNSNKGIIREKVSIWKYLALIKKFEFPLCRFCKKVKEPNTCVSISKWMSISRGTSQASCESLSVSLSTKLMIHFIKAHNTADSRLGSAGLFGRSLHMNHGSHSFTPNWRKLRHGKDQSSSTELKTRADFASFVNTRHVHTLLSRRPSLSSSALPRYSSAIADWASRNRLPQPHWQHS